MPARVSATAIKTTSTNATSAGVLSSTSPPCSAAATLPRLVTDTRLACLWPDDLQHLLLEGVACL